MKNHRRILISGIAVVCLLCIIIYLVLFCPITYKKNRVISDSDGQKKNVIFDVVLHREFGRVHKMNGKVIMDEREYISCNDLYNINSEFISHVFQIPNNNALSGTENRVIIDLEQGSMKSFHLLLVKDGKLNEYHSVVNVGLN